MEENQTGADISTLILSKIGNTALEDLYIDEDEEGRFLGLVFSDGESEYHLTIETDGTIQLAEGPIDGDELDEVLTFNLDDVDPPFSPDGTV